MAQRRMFSKIITNSSNFLMMPQSSQNLYFHLGMNADDDGFCEHFTVMRMTESKPDDLRILQAKGFVRVFDEKVLIIIDWRENNYLRSDRYTASKYLKIYMEELKILSSSNTEQESGIPVVDKMATQDRLGKDRLGKDTDTAQSAEVPAIINLFKEVNPSYRRLFGMPTQRAAADRLLKQHGFEKLSSMIAFLPKSNESRYAPTITTPSQFEAKLGQLIAWSKKQNDTKKTNVAFI